MWVRQQAIHLTLEVRQITFDEVVAFSFGVVVFDGSPGVICLFLLLGFFHLNPVAFEFDVDFPLFTLVLEDEQ